MGKFRVMLGLFLRGWGVLPIPEGTEKTDKNNPNNTKCPRAMDGWNDVISLQRKLKVCASLTGLLITFKGF